MCRKDPTCRSLTYGAAVHWALDFARKASDLSIDILDLRSLLPLDYEAIRSSAMRTGKILDAS